MMMLKAGEILDPQTGVHYARIATFRDISGLHCHDFWEFFLIVRGRVWHIANGRRSLLEAGDLVLIRPSDGHRYERYESEDCELINLAYTAATLDALVAFLGPLPAGLFGGDLPPVRRLTPAEQAAVLAELAGLADFRRASARAEARAVLAHLFVRYLGAGGGQAPSLAAAPAWLNRLLGEMQVRENLAGGVARLHELCPVSPEHLCRTMRRFLGRSPTQWVNDQRLALAAGLLAQTGMEVVAVALQAGFENLSHFYHLFRERFGCSPARYRKRNGRVIIPQ